MEFIISQPVQIQAMMLFVVVWGLFEGVNGVKVKVISLVTGRPTRQNNLGRFLQCLWYVCLVVLVVYYFC